MNLVPKCILTLLAFSSLETWPLARAQDHEPIVTKVETDGTIVTITYDLPGSPGESLYVQLLLMDDPNSSAPVLLRQVKGDVGERQSPGVNKRIVWNMHLEGIRIAEGRPYRFEIKVTRPEDGGFPWYLYAGGGAVVVGAVLLLLPGSSSDPATVDQAKSIPLPPPR